MALQTRGFTLSATPTAPRIPNNMGIVDVKAIDEGVRRGLDTFEKLRRAPQSMILADEAGATQIAQQQAQRAVIPTQTAAILADTPNRSSLLAGQTQIAKRTLPLQEAQIGAQETEIARQAERRGRADAQLKDYLAARDAANGLASFQTAADDLATLPTKFPDVEAIYPEHAKTRAALETTARTAEENRLKRESAESIAGMRTGAAGKSSTVIGLLDRIDAIDSALADDPENGELLARKANAQAALQKLQAASVVDPVAESATRERIAAAKNATTATVASGRAKTAQDKLRIAAEGNLINTEALAQDLGDLIDDSIAKVTPLTAGFGGTVLSKLPGTDASDLAKNIDTIKANVGFQALNAMRALSATGGALGQVSDTENRFLQATLASLDNSQSVAQLKTNLEVVKRKLNESLGRLRVAYEKQYGAGSSAAVNQPSAPAASGFKIVEIQ